MNAKKIIALALTALVSVGMIFAQGSFVVKSVKGTVTYESAGAKKAVTVGQTLSASTVINVGMSSNLVLEADGAEYTVKAMSRGALEKFVNVPAGNGLKRGGPVAGSSSVKSDNGTGKSVSTASSRAEDQQSELPFDEGNE